MSKEALAQPEPVGKYTGETWDGSIISLYDEIPIGTLLYTTPPQRTWIGLTDEEKWQIFGREDYQGWLDYINAIEAKVKENNFD